MRVGSGVYVGPGSWFQAGDGDGVAISIGDGCSFVGWCTLSAMSGIFIGERVLFARGVYIADHEHEFRRVGVPVLDQGHRDVRPVVVGPGAWLGQNVVVLAGSNIG
nr:hypothetical protein [Micromonospora sp. DSM 115978]